VEQHGILSVHQDIVPFLVGFQDDYSSYTELGHAFVVPTPQPTLSLDILDRLWQQSVNSMVANQGDFWVPRRESCTDAFVSFCWTHD